MGAHFNITCILDADIKQFNATHAIIGADHKGTNLANHKIATPWVLVLGNEAHGISERTRENINHLIAIPRIGTGESLNVATAGGILMEKLKAIN
jgi:TrmH family RNA methyltransferase